MCSIREEPRSQSRFLDIGCMYLDLRKSRYGMDQKTPNPKGRLYRLYWCLIKFIDWRYSQSCWWGGSGCVESIYRSYTLYMTRFRTYKIALPPQRGEGPRRQINTCRHVPFRLILKKNRHSGFGVIIDIWSIRYGDQGNTHHHMYDYTIPLTSSFYVSYTGAWCGWRVSRTAASVW